MTPGPSIREHADGVEVETGPSPVAAVVWLHGLGADGHDFVPIVPELALAIPVRFVFPHAPVRPVTLNAGLAMRAWYDVFALEGPHREDEAGIRESARRIEALLARERARGLPPERLVLAGFSQGGAMALHVGLRAAEALAGLLALSSYLPLAGRVADEATAVGRRLPVFLAHGTADPLIPLRRARDARDRLRALGCPVEWHEYPAGHTVTVAELRDVAAWLEARLGAA